MKQFRARVASRGLTRRLGGGGGGAYVFAGVVTAFAGNGSGAADVNGTGAAAGFKLPLSIATNAATGLMYIGLSSAIRTLTPDGVAASFVGGSVGANNGQGAAAQFYFVNGITVLPSGIIAAVGAGGGISHDVRIITAGGLVSRLAGGNATGAYLDSATGTSAQFNSPTGIVFDSTRSVLYVADRLNHRIRQVTYPGGAVTTLAGNGTYSAFHIASGVGTSGLIPAPYGITINSTSTILYIAGNNHIASIVISTGVITRIAGNYQSGNVNQPGADARFNGLRQIYIDPTDTVLYVAEYDNSAVRKIIIATGVVSTLATVTSAESITMSADAKKMYVTDRTNNNIVLIT